MTVHKLLDGLAKEVESPHWANFFQKLKLKTLDGNISENLGLELQKDPRFLISIGPAHEGLALISAATYLHSLIIRDTSVDT